MEFLNCTPGIIAKQLYELERVFCKAINFGIYAADIAYCSSFEKNQETQEYFVTAKEIAKAFGIKVYTIGVGTEGYALLPQQANGVVVRTQEKVNIDEILIKIVQML